MRRRDTLAAAAALACAARVTAAPAAPGTIKVLRYAFPVGETGFDPAQINDKYSRDITCHIFEALYAYDHLARPARIVPLTADGMPEVEDDYRRWTFRIRSGIFFADDAAFGGRRRELVAEDYVFAFKRFADPAVKSPVWSTVEAWGVPGLAALRREALEHKKPFDYTRPVQGLRALDARTLQFELAEPRPRFVEQMANSDQFGAVAHEVVAAWGERIAEHPVGTGPFRLAQWRRSSLIVLERNPGYRERLWDCQPAADDAEGQAIAQRLRGRRLPLVDRVEVSIIEETQPRWLSFLNRQSDLIERLPAEFINVAMPGGRVAPNLARQGIRGQRVLMPDIALTVYNMEHPVIGGLAPERVALRRAMNLAIDIDKEIRLVRRGMAIPAQSPIYPHASGWDPAFKSESGDHDPARAKALLDLYGWVDRDGDGWREQPDGQPLVLEHATQPDQASRQLNELFQKDMNAVGLKVVFRPAKWPENLKAARAGKLMIWGVASLADNGDGLNILNRFYGKQVGQLNLARLRLPAFDALYQRLASLPDGAERLALFDQAKRLAVAYAPYKLHVHRYAADLMHPWVLGYRRPIYWGPWWTYVDIDRPAAG